MVILTAVMAIFHISLDHSNSTHEVIDLLSILSTYLLKYWI